MSFLLNEPNIAIESGNYLVTQKDGTGTFQVYQQSRFLIDHSVCDNLTQLPDC